MATQTLRYYGRIRNERNAGRVEGPRNSVPVRQSAFASPNELFAVDAVLQHRDRDPLRRCLLLDLERDREDADFQFADESSESR